MESDCYPVVPNWLTKLEQVCVENPDAWVIGTQYCGVSPLSGTILRHINGNALYKIGDKAYWRFLSNFIWPWMHRQINAKNLYLCYDCVWEHYLYSLLSKSTPHHARFQARKNLPRFRNKNYIVNVAGRAEIDGDYIWTRAELLKQYPGAVLIHGPFVTSTGHLRGGFGLGKPSKASGVITEPSRIRYSGPNERGKVRYERSFWLLGKPLDAESSIHLAFSVQCESQTSGVIVELHDESRSIIGRKIVSNTGGNLPKVADCDWMMNVPRTYVYLSLRFFGAGDTCTVELSNVSLESRRLDKVLAKTESVFD